MRILPWILSGMFLLRALAAEVPPAMAFPASGTPGTLPFVLAAPARVSAAVYDKTGAQVRELLRAVPMEAGAHTLEWDGLDLDGKPCAPGEYECRLLRTRGFTSAFRGLIGVNPSSGIQGPYPLNWVGDHHGAGIVAVDETGVYVGAKMTEGLMLALKQSHDGSRRLWQIGQFYDGGQLTDLCPGPNNRLYLAQPNGLIRVHDITDGTPAKAPWEVKIDDESPSDIDYHDGDLILCYPGHDTIRWLDPEFGDTLQTLRGIRGARYVSIVRGGTNGLAYVVGSNFVCTVQRALLKSDDPKSAVRKVLTLEAPGPIDVDPANGDLYLVDTSNGACVRRYNSALEPVKTYGGRRRPLGLYDPTLFGDITSIAADGRGCFYVAEPASPPRRIAKFDASTGAVVKEWYGGQSFYTALGSDPEDPTLLWGVAQEGFIHQYKLDYNSGTWVIRACYANGLQEDNLFPLASFAFPLRIGGKLYLAGAGIPTLGRVDEARGIIVPVAAIGTAITGNRSLNQFPGTGRGGYSKAWVAAAEKAGFQDLNTAPKQFIWGDLNGNGAADPEEFSLASVPLNFGSALDRQMNLFCCLTMGWDSTGAVVRIGSSGMGGVNGDVPLWSWTNLHAIARLPADTPGFHGLRFLWSDGTDLYGTLQGGVMIRDHGQYEGGSWPYMSITMARFLKWAGTDGNPLFAVSRHTKDPSEANTGKFFYPMHVTAGARNTVLVNDQIFQPGVIWTRDGLYAGSLWEQRVQDPWPDSLYRAYGDDIQGAHMVELPDGRVFYFTMGVGLWLMYQIEGFDALQSFKAPLLSPETVRAATRTGKGLKATYYADLDGQVVSETCVEAPLYYQGPYAASTHPNQPNPPWKAVWEGQLEAPCTANYRFEFMLGHDETARLELDGVTLLSGGSHAVKTSVPMQAGRKYKIRIEYTNPAAAAELKFLWWGDQLDKSRVPAELLYE